MSGWKYCWSLLPSMVFALCVVGCGGQGLSTVPVTGTVTYKGKPLEGVSVGFVPEPQKGHPATGLTDESGRFTLSSFKAGDGATPGEYRVVIAEPSSADSEDYSLPDPSKARFPLKYSDPNTSGLKATVTSGAKNDFTFDLTD